MNDMAKAVKHPQDQPISIWDKNILYPCVYTNNVNNEICMPNSNKQRFLYYIASMANINEEVSI